MVHHRCEDDIKMALAATLKAPTEANVVALATIYIRSANYYAHKHKWHDCLDCLQCAEALSLCSKAYNSMIVTEIAAMCVECRNIVNDSAIVDAMFDLVANIDFSGNHALRKCLFSPFHWYSHFWDGYLDFCDWWGFENFEGKDFTITDKRNCLAESAYIAYSRRLSTHYVAGYMFDFFIKFIDTMLANSNFTVYSDYHIASFMLRVGFNQQEVLRGFRRYIKQKFKKTWSWMRLAKLFEDYREFRIILEMKEKLSEKFASPNHAGPTDVAAFLDLVDEEEIAFTKRDAYEQIQALIRRLE